MFTIINNSDKRKFIYYAIIFMLSLLFFARIINLDCDLPGFGISFYQPIDEGLYSRASINYFKYGSISSTGDYALELNPVFKSNAFQTLLQYLSLKLFGNNYYGLRMPSIIIASIIFCFIYKVTKLVLQQYKIDEIQSNKLVIIIMVFIICDFSFLMLSRTVENSNMRALSGIITLYLYLKFQKKDLFKYFLMAFFSITSLFLIYFSNIYIGLATGMFAVIVILRRDWKKIKMMVIGGGTGGFVGIFISELYYRLIWKTGALESFIQGIFSFSDRTGAGTENSNLLINWIKNGFIFFDSNMFFFNIFFLGASLIALIFNTYISVKKNNEFCLYTELLIWAVILQSIFTHDWMERKAIMIYPILIINLVLFYIYVQTYNICKKKLAFASAIIFMILLLISYTMVRFRNSYNYFLDFEKLDLQLLLGANVIQLIIFCILLLLIISRKNTIKPQKVCLIICFLTSISVNLFYSFKYAYLYDVYSEKEAMKQIGNVVGKNYVIGPYAYGFTLYNNIEPISANIEDYKEYIKNSDINYIIDYSASPYYVESILPDENMELIQSYDRSISLYGTYREIGIFQKK